MIRQRGETYKELTQKANLPDLILQLFPTQRKETVGFAYNQF